MNGWDAVIVGAGPAGSAAAAILASAGRCVLVLEKDHFPRVKVCGQFLSGDATASLDRIGALSAVQAASPEVIREGRVHLPDGRAVPFRLPVPALGISRFRFDALLATRAREAGADVRFGRRVASVSGPRPESGGRFEVQFAGTEGSRASDPHGRQIPEETISARTVVGAWGRWDALDKRLDRRFLRRTRYFGWSREYAGDTRALAGSVRLYIFPGGYCGLSRDEEGTVNLAGVLSEKARRALGGSWEHVVRHARRSNAALDADLSNLAPGPRGDLGTVPVVFTAKPPAEDSILMTGDAAGVIDPFSGQGQAAALASGILAGETVLALLDGRIRAEDYARTYRTAWRRLFSRRFAWSAVFRRLMLHPALGSAAATLGGERLVRLGMRSLWGKAAVD